MCFPTAVLSGNMGAAMAATAAAHLGFQLSMGLYNSMLVNVFPSEQR